MLSQDVKNSGAALRDAQICGRIKLGGRYPQLDVLGVAQAVSALEIDKDFRLSGQLTAAEVCAKLVRWEGRIECERLNCKNVTISGQIRIVEMLCSTCQLEGRGSIDRLHVMPRNKSEESPVAFTMKGAFNLGEIESGDFNYAGILNARTIVGTNVSITVEGSQPSTIEAVSAEKVSIAPKDHSSPLLTVQSIRATEAILERVHAHSIEGDKITVGAGCEIEQVHYRTWCHVAAGATVKRAVKLN